MSSSVTPVRSGPLTSANVGAFADLANQLDADDRVKGKQFEHICKWFLTNDPVYKHELRRVWRWDEWPGHGELWAIRTALAHMRRPSE
jgi:hypothetical protein